MLRIEELSRYDDVSLSAWDAKEACFCARRYFDIYFAYESKEHISSLVLYANKELKKLNCSDGDIVKIDGEYWVILGFLPCLLTVLIRERDYRNSDVRGNIDIFYDFHTQYEVVGEVGEIDAFRLKLALTNTELRWLKELIKAEDIWKENEKYFKRNIRSYVTTNTYYLEKLRSLNENAGFLMMGGIAFISSGLTFLDNIFVLIGLAILGISVYWKLQFGPLLQYKREKICKKSETVKW